MKKSDQRDAKDSNTARALAVAGMMPRPFSGAYAGRRSCMSVPNLKQRALFVQKWLGGSRNFDIGSRDPGHAHFGVVLFSIHRRGGSSVSVPNFEADWSIRSKSY